MKNPLRSLTFKAERPSRGRQGGFTLFELLLTLVLLGILTLVLSPSFRALLTARDLAYFERQSYINSLIAQSMLDYAETPPTYDEATVSLRSGGLPAPYTRGGQRVYSAAPAAPLKESLAASVRAYSLEPYASRRGVPPSELVGDGRVGDRVRVYQVASGVEQELPFYFKTGPLMIVEYDLGVVYMTGCERKNTACNSTAKPPTTAAGDFTLTLANHKTWVAPPDAIGLTYVSTLDQQKKMMVRLAGQMDQLREQFLRYYKAKGVFPTAYEGTNSMGGDAQCHDGWHRLGTHMLTFPDGSPPVANDLLSKVGFSGFEMAITPWGASIWYCADYAPHLTAKPKGAPPHYAALRVDRNLSRAWQFEESQTDRLPEDYAVISF